MQGIRYAIVLVAVTTIVALGLNVRGGYPVYESIMGGVVIAVFACIVVAQRGEWMKEWRDIKGK